LELPILYFLDRFYTSRISIRFLVRHHIEVYKSFSEKRKDPKRRATLVGLVDTDCIVKEILEDAYRDASFLSQQHYTQSPELKIVCPQDIRNFTYIPLHLYYIFFELLKNSLRAVIEFHKDKNELPCIQAIIVKGAEDLSIKISDQGGGIPRSDWLSVNSYMFSTANKIPELSISPTFDINNAPLAGYGFGLPLSRLYAKYLGGDLQIISLENYGTDAYIHLKATAKDSSEVLPAFSPAAIKNYSSIIPLKWKILK
jgi:pyruvate dehydrogenase kinase 2/3/4